MEIPEMQAEVTLTSVHAAIEDIDFDKLIEVKAKDWLGNAIGNSTDDHAGEVLFDMLEHMLNAYKMDIKRADL